MEIQWLSYDWEPCVLRFVFCANTPPPIEFQRLVHEWTETRETDRECYCRLRLLTVATIESDLEVSIENVCNTCLPGLLDSIAMRFALQRVEVGEHPSSAVTPVDMTFVNVPPKRTRLESGIEVRTSQLKISKFPISVGQFRTFAEMCNYTTTAESLGSEETYLANTHTYELTPDELLSIPVTFVSNVDATAFCRAMSFRLPTEEEWVAASLVDSRLFTKAEYRQCLPALTANLSSLSQIATEWTSTIDESSSLNVVRRGPKWARLHNWIDRVSMNRLTSQPENFDAMTTFRVVVRER